MKGPGAWVARALGISLPAGQGLFFITSVAAIWVAASFIVQDIEEAGVHPAVLTYTANSLFAIYLPIYYLKEWLAKRFPRQDRSPTDGEAQSLVLGPAKEGPDGPPEAQPRHQILRAALVVCGAAG